MKKISVLVAVVLVACMFIFIFRGNKQLFDFNREFNYAYVRGLNGNNNFERIAITSWKDYEGEQFQIKTKDGNVYVISSYNCILAYEE